MSEIKFGLIVGLYTYCVEHHTGQRCWKYQLMCKLQNRYRIKMSPLFKGYDSLDDCSRHYYDMAVKKYN